MANLISIRRPREEGELIIRSDQIASIEDTHRHSYAKAIVTRACDGATIEVDEWPADIVRKIEGAEGK